MQEEAGFWIRLGANLLDSILIALPLSIIGWVLTGDFENEPISNICFGLYSIFLPVYWNGRTLGKKICGIRIRKVDDQESPGIGTMLLRNVISGFMYAFTLGIAVIVSAIMIAVREDKRSLHDFIAGTEVVYDE